MDKLFQEILDTQKEQKEIMSKAISELKINREKSTENVGSRKFED